MAHLLSTRGCDGVHDILSHALACDESVDALQLRIHCNVCGRGDHLHSRLGQPVARQGICCSLVKLNIRKVNPTHDHAGVKLNFILDQAMRTYRMPSITVGLQPITQCHFFAHDDAGRTHAFECGHHDTARRDTFVVEILLVEILLVEILLAGESERNFQALVKIKSPCGELIYEPQRFDS